MSRTGTRLGIAFAIVALVGVAVGMLLTAKYGLPGSANGAKQKPAATTPAQAATPALPARPADLTPGATPNFVELVKSAGPAVVSIDVELGRRSFGGEAGRGQGSGFIVSEDGFILTNDHVVGKAAQIRVLTADGRQLDGKVIGTDPKTDIALIKVEDESKLPTVYLGDSDGVEVGEWVVAIGNPFGLDHTVTAGIISAKGRRDVRPGGRRDGYFDFLQTDASINPGNSGGPLLNARGEVIGINSAVNAAGQGLGFAIPINMAKTLLPLLKEHGRAPRSWLGVSIQALSRDMADTLGLPSTDGALVADVVSGSPAAKAGVAPGEVIVTFDGKDVRRSDDLPWLASTAGIGKKVTLKLLRKGGKSRDVVVTLEEMPSGETLARGISTSFGLEVATVTERLAKDLGLDRPGGAVVVNVNRDSPLRGTIGRGDVVVKIDDQVVETAEDFSQIVKAIRGGERLRVLIYRRGEPMWLAFETALE